MCDIAANSFGQQSSFSRDQQQDSLSQLCVPELVSAQGRRYPERDPRSRMGDDR